jgi:tRNA/tmRNA/rRNA uracil-C5-methylase (TrmA/RlmC/RlmD family)
VPRSHPKKSLPLLEPSQKEWEIERLVPGGAGFVRLASGQGAFARGALPGERICVEQAEDHRTYLQATRWSLLRPSADRVAPACPVQARCGGCDLMTLNERAQLAAKAGILREALVRTGHFQALPEIQFVPSERTLRYRSRIRLHIASDGRVGFFAAHSQELVEIPGCLVADAELDAALQTLRELVTAHRAAWSRFAECELRVAPAGPRLSLCLVPRTAELGRTDELLRALAELPAKERFDLVVLDPPRSGAREILPELVRRKPAHIAYCACDPVTLARDLRSLCDAGYVLQSLTGFDMFPQTHHFETLAWLGATAPA